MSATVSTVGGGGGTKKEQGKCGEQKVPNGEPDQVEMVEVIVSSLSLGGDCSGVSRGERKSEGFLWGDLESR